jgi:hypothetical protein
MQKHLQPYLFACGWSLLMIGGCASPTSNPQSSNAPTSTSASIPSTPKNTDKPKANNYSESFIKDFTGGCVSSIKRKTEDDKKAVCTCILNKAQESYTAEEFVKASQELNIEKKTPPKLVEIMLSCAK